MKKCPSVPKNTTIVFADPERYKNARFVPIAPRTVNLAGVYNASASVSASSASNRVKRGTATQDRRGIPEAQDLGQGEAGGKFHPCSTSGSIN